MFDVGFLRYAALACRSWIMDISWPALVTLEFRLMFWDLNGVTTNPLLASILHMAATVSDFPASDVAPRIISAFPSLKNLSLHSRNTSLILGSLPSVMPSSPNLLKEYSTTSFLWLKRHCEQSHISLPLPLLDSMLLPRSVSLQG